MFELSLNLDEGRWWLRGVSKKKTDSTIQLFHNHDAYYAKLVKEKFDFFSYNKFFILSFLMIF